MGLLRLVCLWSLAAAVAATSATPGNLVYTQLSQIVSLTNNSGGLSQKCTARPSANAKQYSMWGWFRFTGTTQTNSNILTLKKVSGTGPQTSTGNSKAFPPCPYTAKEFHRNPSLMTLSAVTSNPNCVIPLAAAGSSNIVSQDLLYVNFNYYPATRSANPTFDLVFLIQNGVANGASSMIGEGFMGQSLPAGSWVFWGVSLDYAKKTGFIFYQIFDGQERQGVSKAITLNFPGFQFGSDLLLSVGSTNTNPYMASVDPFVGQIGYVEFGIFFTAKLNLLWMGFNPTSNPNTPVALPSPNPSPSLPPFSGPVCLDLIFNSVLMTITDSVSNFQYRIRGDCSPITSRNNTQVGISFYTNSAVAFTNFQRSTRGVAVQSLTFFLQFSFQETLPGSFVLIQKGTKGLSSHFAVSLISRPGANGRFLSLVANNRMSETSWTSEHTFAPGVTHSVIIGLTTDLANGLYLVYMDASRSLFPQLKCSFPFDLSIDGSTNLLYLFNNQDSGTSAGFVSLYRFVLLNSASLAIYNALLSPVAPPPPASTNTTQITNTTVFNQSVSIVINNYNYNSTSGVFNYGGYSDCGQKFGPDDEANFCDNYDGKCEVYNPHGCLLGSSYYGKSNYCLLCPGGQVATLNGSCVALCPYGYATFGGNSCLPCADVKCTCPAGTIPNNTHPANPTTIYLWWTIIEITNVHYRIVPSLPVLNVNINPYQLVVVTFPGLPPRTGYNLTVDVQNQWINLHVNVTQFVCYNLNVNLFINFTTVHKKISICGDSTSTSVTNVTVLNYPNTTYSRNGTWNYTIFQVCNLDSDDRTTYNALAITILAVLTVVVILLLFITCCCWNSTPDLGGLWKYFLYQWVKLTFVAFLIVLGVHLPCCLRQFLNILYLIGVRWDQAFSEVINSAFSQNWTFWSGVFQYSPPMNFRQVGVFAFILHNMMIGFIIHLFIFTIWILVMIWDCLITSRGRCMYYTYIFMQFTVLIVGYVFFSMHAWVFAALNIRTSPFSNAYFVICFIIALLYLIVFVLFWLYSAYRLCGPSSYFLDEVRYANFYYFFAGFRENKIARTFDLIFLAIFFAIGLTIGFLFDHPLVQTVLILVALVLLFLALILIHPWRYWVFTILEIISVLLLIIVAAILVYLATHVNAGCFLCGTREGGMCHALVALLFVALLLPLLGLIGMALVSACCAQRASSWAYKSKTYQESEAFYGYEFGQQHTQQVVTATHYVTEQTAYIPALRKDVEGVLLHEVAAQNLLATQVVAQEVICASCRYSIDTCPIHGRGVQVVQECQGMTGYDARRSMLDFMNELRAKRVATNTRVQEIQTTNVQTETHENTVTAETRYLAQGHETQGTSYRTARRLSEDRADDEYKQARIMNIMDQREDDALIARRGSGNLLAETRNETSYRDRSHSQTRTEEYSSTSRSNRTSAWRDDRSKYEQRRYR